MSLLQSVLLTMALTCCIGAPAQTVETSVAFAPSDTTDHYANGVVLETFRDTLYCMWQSSSVHEDSIDTRVVYSRSADGGRTWTQPATLAWPCDTAYCTSGGWRVHGDTLTAFVDIWPIGLTPRGGHTYYILSTDGRAWSPPQPVRMADGTPMQGVLEQDPYLLPGGRLVGASHFQPGLHVCPVYTDDSSGRTGWHRATFAGEDHGKQSRELEPSLFRRPDGTLVMLFRDQGGSFRKLASVSHDDGETWTRPTLTNHLDARTKQCAGNLPGGTAFMVSCPSGCKERWPLVLQLSGDGKTFDRQIVLRDRESLPPRRYEGKAKTLGFSYPKAIVSDGWLYVGYSVNKEVVAVTRVKTDTIEGADATIIKDTTAARNTPPHAK